jgi:hypothetical protein
MDELNAIEERLGRDGDPASRQARAAQLFDLAIQAARDHHDQQAAEHELELERQRRQERHAACMRRLEIAVAHAVGILLIVTIAAVVIAVVAGRVDPLDLLLPPRG